jgi:hypothetical protein
MANCFGIHWSSHRYYYRRRHVAIRQTYLQVCHGILAVGRRSLNGVNVSYCRLLGKLSLTFNHVDMAGKKNSHELVSGRKRKQDSNNNTVVNVITCWSRNKHYESKNNHVLIDDRLSLREDWENNGGIFIHHTSSEKTIQALRERGIISSSRDL